MASKDLSKDGQLVEARNRHNRDLALHHANLLQQRKDTESLILSAIEELLEFPTFPQAYAHAPALDDVHRFQELIKPFQISDYKDLIEERNIAYKCGYVFCPNPVNRNRGSGGGQLLRIVRGSNEYGGSGGKQGLTVVPDSKVEMWCDKWCARQAMSIQVQLSDTPAWERATTKEKVIVRVEAAVQNGREESALERKKLSEEKNYRLHTDELRQSMAELALERGEKSIISGKVSATIMHRNTPQSSPRPPQLEQNGGGTIEGYVPKTRISKNLAGNENDADDVDMDWQLS